MSVTVLTATIDTHFNAGPHSGTEKMEIWVRSALGGGWIKKDDNTVAGVVNYSRTVTGLHPGTDHDFAMRLTRSGAAQAGSTSADPLDWPAGHRQLAQTTLLDDPVDSGSFIADALGGPGISQLYCFIDRTDSDLDPLQADLFYEFEVDTGAGYGPLDAFPGPTNEIAANEPGYVFDSADDIGIQVIVEPYAGTTIDVRMRRKTAYQTSDWMELLGLVIPA